MVWITQSGHNCELLSRPRRLFGGASEILVVLRKKPVDPLPLALAVLLLDHGAPMMPDTVTPFGEDINFKSTHRHAKSVSHFLDPHSAKRRFRSDRSGPAHSPSPRTWQHRPSRLATAVRHDMGMLAKDVWRLRCITTLNSWGTGQ